MNAINQAEKRINDAMKRFPALLFDHRKKFDDAILVRHISLEKWTEFYQWKPIPSDFSFKWVKISERNER